VNRNIYEKRLSSVLIPASIVETTNTPGDDSSWCARSERNLLHDYYRIRTSDPKLKRSDSTVISFNAPLDFEEEHQDRSIFYSDKLTKKILCVELLKQGVTARSASSERVRKILNHFDWIVRWRNARSIPAFSMLTAEDYEQYFSDFSTTDILVAVPLIDRLDTLVDDPDYKLPLHHRYADKFRLSWGELAHTLGVPRAALIQSQSFIDAFEKRLPTFLEKSSVDPNAVQVFGRGKQSAPKAVSVLETHSMTWDCLERLHLKQLWGHDNLTFSPSNLQKPARIKPAYRTTTLLPFDMLRLFRACASWVLDYGPYIVRALRQREAISDRDDRKETEVIRALTKRLDSEKPAGLQPLGFGLTRKAFVNDGRLGLAQALQHLFVACAILIGGLTARRKIEVASLKAGCVSGPNSRLRMSVYIAKTRQAEDVVPIPIIVKSVIGLLEELSATARSTTGEEWLFAFQAELANQKILSVDTRFHNNLGDFLRHIDLDPPAGQNHWKLNFHMLRKGFVVSFYHGSLWESFDATNRMLRHSSADMTRIYMDDAETGALSWLRSEVSRLTKIRLAELTAEEAAFLKDAKVTVDHQVALMREWNEGRQEFYVSKMMETYDGDERPIGKGAARMLDALRFFETKALSRIHFSAVPTNAPDGVRDDVEKQVKIAAATNFMEPVPGGPYYCLFKRGSTEDAEIANCLKLRATSRKPWLESKDSGDDIRPDYAFSSAYACIGCELCAMFNENQKAVQKEIDEMRSNVRRAATPQLAASAAAYVDDLFNLLSEAGKAVEGKQRPR